MGEELHFRAFVAEYRKKYGINIKQICYGICSLENYSAFELGKSGLSQAIEERLLERLGICTDDFYEFVNNEEYERWAEKQKIVYEIVTRKLDDAETHLKSFAEEGFEKGAFEKQFYYRMSSFVDMCRGSDNRTIAENLKKCLECTLPDFSIAMVQDYALSIHEIDTILDYLYYSEDMVEEHYLSVVEYINLERFNIKARMVVLAKAVCYYLSVKERKVPVNDWHQADVDAAFEWVERAISYARVKNSSSFLYELLQWRVVLIAQKKKHSQSEKLDAMLQNSKKWQNALKQVAEYARRDVKTIDTAHLYSSTNVENINEIIRRRKSMLQLTNEKIAEGICEKKTIGRAINDKSTPQKYFARQILDRLNYANRLNGNCINADSIEGMLQCEKFRHYVNIYEFEKSEIILETLKQSFHEYNVYNEQFLKGWDAFLKYKNGKIDEATYIEQLKKVMELTVPLENLYKSEKISLSTYELLFFNQYVKRIPEEKLKQPLIVLEKILDEWLGSPYELAHRTGVFLLVETIQNRLGDLGYYELSNEYSNKGIQMSINTRQLSEVAGMFYNMWWNENEKNRTIDEKPEECIRQLSLCMDLAHLSDSAEDYYFYVKKINYIINLKSCRNLDLNWSKDKLCEWLDLECLQEN